MAGLKLNVMVCTLDEGLQQVPKLLLAPRPDVEYLISFQYTTPACPPLPVELTRRADVHVYPLAGRGLSANRNHALSHATGDVLIVADDDVRYTDAGLDRVLDVFRAHPAVDVALFRLKDPLGRWLKRYPDGEFDYADPPHGYYPCSCEIALRRRVADAGVRFDNRFGLGSCYLASGEEDVWLCDVLRRGFTVHGFPVEMAVTDGQTTGLRLLEDVRVQRSKGAVFCYVYGYKAALWRCFKEALHHALRGRAPFLPLFRSMLDGIRYIHHAHEFC